MCRQRPIRSPVYLTRVINFFDLHLKQQQPFESHDPKGVEWVSSIPCAAFLFQDDRQGRPIDINLSREVRQEAGRP